MQKYRFQTDVRRVGKFGKYVIACGSYLCLFEEVPTETSWCSKFMELMTPTTLQTKSDKTVPNLPFLSSSEALSTKTIQKVRSCISIDRQSIMRGGCLYCSKQDEDDFMVVFARVSDQDNSFFQQCQCKVCFTCAKELASDFDISDLMGGVTSSEDTVVDIVVVDSDSDIDGSVTVVDDSHGDLEDEDEDSEDEDSEDEDSEDEDSEDEEFRNANSDEDEEKYARNIDDSEEGSENEDDAITEEEDDDNSAEEEDSVDGFGKRKRKREIDNFYVATYDPSEPPDKQSLTSQFRGHWGYY